MNHLGKIESPIDEFMGDGAYDSHKIYDEIENRNDKGHHIVTIPPPKNAVVSDNFPNNPSKRDKHTDFINTHGRLAWEHKTKYNRRLLVENTMGRFKRIIGAKLRSRILESQKNEAKIGCKILNIMVRLGTPLHPVTKIK